jgi:glutathione S-transferase
VAFERIDIDLANKPDWFLKISPLGKVPVLRVATDDGEAVLFESNVICEYIEETQGGGKLHPQDPLQRAQHRAWMEFGSTILSELWGLETTGDPAVFESKRLAVAAKFARIEEALASGPFFAGKDFGLVDAVFAPIFRYFDVFDTLIDLSVFAETPKVRAWRTALAQRPSVKSAVGADYPQLLHAFLVRYDAHMLKLAA